MEKKICPVCEHVMSGKHYCRVCRKWIWHPKVIHADYYLNERHPAQEENCEYHRPAFMEKKNSSAPAKMPVQPGRQSHPRPYARQTQARPIRPVQPQPVRQNQDGKIPLSPTLIIIFVAVLLTILLSILMPVFMFLL